MKLSNQITDAHLIFPCEEGIFTALPISTAHRVLLPLYMWIAVECEHDQVDLYKLIPEMEKGEAQWDNWGYVTGGMEGENLADWLNGLWWHGKGCPWEPEGEE